MKLKQTEKQLQNAILDWLKWNKIFCWQVDNTGVYDPRIGRFRKNPRKTKGVPDIICVHRGLVVGIEVKSQTGRLSAEQTEFAKNFTAAGGNYIEARGIKTVEVFFKGI